MLASLGNPERHVAAIGIAGPIASGKSTVIECLSRMRLCHVVSYGDYVRAVATSRGIERSRDALQALSNELLGEYGHSGLAELVIRSRNWGQDLPLIIDGVRHVEAIEAIKQILEPIPTHLVFVRTPIKVRMERIKLRDSIAQKTAKQQDLHDTELEVSERLRYFADTVVDGTNPELSAAQINERFF